MTALTPIYGFEFEEPGDRPAVTLSGGPTGDEALILAESVEEELDRVETTHNARLEALEETPAVWVSIRDRTVHTGVSSFLVSGIEAAAYQEIRLRMRGTLQGDPSSGFVRLRINEDSESGLHKSNALVHSGSGSLEASTSGDFTTWRLAQWGIATGNGLTVDLFPVDAERTISYECHGMRVGGSAGTNTTTRAWGRINSAQVLSSFRVFAGAGSETEFANVTYWVEGRLL